MTAEEIDAEMSYLWTNINNYVLLEHIHLKYVIIQKASEETLGEKMMVILEDNSMIEYIHQKMILAGVEIVNKI